MYKGLRAGWERWGVVAEKIAHIQARLIFTILYFVVVAPFAIGVRLFSDPLRLRHPVGDTFWTDRKHQTLSIEDARKQS